MCRGEAYYFSSSTFVLILSIASSSTHQISSSRKNCAFVMKVHTDNPICALKEIRTDGVTTPLPYSWLNLHELREA